jgi:hypothetical protein
MPKNWPILRCLGCDFTWRRYAGRKLTPSRNCPKCFKRLKIEHEDYEWESLGTHEFQETEKKIARGEKSTNKDIEVEVSIFDIMNPTSSNRLSKKDKEILDNL